MYNIASVCSFNVSGYLLMSPNGVIANDKTTVFHSFKINNFSQAGARFSLSSRSRKV